MKGNDVSTRTKFPESLTRQWVKVQDMRYGENPHQEAAFYRERNVAPGLLAGYHQLHGKELSYNNIADSDAAWEAVRSFDSPACVIIKHANPCGAAIGMIPDKPIPRRSSATRPLPSATSSPSTAKSPKKLLRRLPNSSLKSSLRLSFSGCF